ncbi:MAG TPA: TlpA disulfide reductase family protein [Trueperaceae bacterium]
MTAFQLGPFVLSAPRFYAGLGLLVLVLVAELRRPDAGWAWAAALAVFAGARLGYVVENLALFARDPVAVLQFWQGGFSPWWGVALGAVVVTWAVWRGHVSFAGAALPAVLALATWLVVPALFTAAPVTPHVLPSLTLETLAGDELDVGTLQGQPVVINLWATWCPPCRRELPMMEAAARSSPDVRFVFADQAEPRDTVARYLEEQGLRLETVVLDDHARLGSEFGSVGLPTTLFFDSEGDHVLTRFGEISSVAMANYISDLRSGSTTP